MSEQAIKQSIENMRQNGVVFESGLSESETEHIERRYGFRFPPDLRMFLQIEMPVSENGFLNWRSDSDHSIRERLTWPCHGICFDVEHNEFWIDEWGQRPSHLESAFRIVNERLVDAPTLIPVFSHRYIPDEPCSSGNPIFSVHQTDIIYYGSNLCNYIENEFVSHSLKLTGEIRHIRFWSDLTS